LGGELTGGATIHDATIYEDASTPEGTSAGRHGISAVGSTGHGTMQGSV